MNTRNLATAHCVYASYFFIIFCLSHNTLVAYIITKTMSTIAEAGAWTLTAYSWLCADMLFSFWVRYPIAPQLSYFRIDAPGTCFRGCCELRSPSALRSCKGWQCTKHKLFNNWEPETEGQTNCKGCTDIFLREDKQEIRKESLGLASSVLLGDLYL